MSSLRCMPDNDAITRLAWDVRPNVSSDARPRPRINLRDGHFS